MKNTKKQQLPQLSDTEIITDFYSDMSVYKETIGALSTRYGETLSSPLFAFMGSLPLSEDGKAVMMPFFADAIGAAFCCGWLVGKEFGQTK